MFRFLRSFDLERKLVSRFPERLRQRFAVGDHFAARFMERHGVTVLRVALAIVFIWFGALKVLDRSPVEEIIKETVFFLPGNTFFFLLGLAEIVIGVGLLIPIALRVTLVLFWLQMGGTFLTLAVLPELAFQGGNPLLLSVLGEFVVKNIVLIAAGLVIGASIHRRAKPHHASESTIARRAPGASGSGNELSNDADPAWLPLGAPATNSVGDLAARAPEGAGANLLRTGVTPCERSPFRSEASSSPDNRSMLASPVPWTARGSAAMPLIASMSRLTAAAVSHHGVRSAIR